MKTIRLAQLSDLAAIETIVRQAIAHMRAHDIDQWDELYPEQLTLERDIRRQEMSVLLVADQICGLITINDQESPEYRQVDWKFSGQVQVVHRLTVAPCCQAKGFAKDLVVHAETLAVKNGSNTIRLDAFADNPRALKLYE